MIRCRIGCSVLVAAALLCAACGGGPGSATPETASSQAQVVEAAGSLQPSSTVAVPVVEAAGSLRPFSTVAVPVVEAAGSLRPFSTVAVPVVEAPVLELGELEVGFFAYGEGGDESTAAMAGVRIAIIDDPDAWWRALRDDAPDGMDALPPGYRVKISPERLETAPARFVVTADDGTAVAPVDAGRDYLYCAIAPEADDLIAGCTEKHYRGGGRRLHVYLSRDHGYFMVHDNQDGTSHYEQYQQRGAWPQDPVTVTYVTRSILDYSDDSAPKGWSFSESGTLAVVADADIDEWWRVISLDNRLAISIREEYPFYAWAEWGSSDQFGPLWKQIPRERFDSAPANYLSLGPGGTATTTLAPGDYLFCYVGRKSLPDTVDLCKYEDVAATHHPVIEYSAFGEPGLSEIREHSQHIGTRTLNELQEYLKHLEEDRENSQSGTE